MGLFACARCPMLFTFYGFLRSVKPQKGHTITTMSSVFPSYYCIVKLCKIETKYPLNYTKAESHLRLWEQQMIKRWKRREILHMNACVSLESGNAHIAHRFQPCIVSVHIGREHRKCAKFVDSFVVGSDRLVFLSIAVPIQWGASCCVE